MEHHGEINDMSRCILIESKLDKNWREHARETAVCIYNRVMNAQDEVPHYTQMLIYRCGTR